MKTGTIGNFVFTGLEVKAEDLDSQDIEIKIKEEQEIDTDEEVSCDGNGAFVTMGQEVNKDMGLAILQKLDEISRRLENVEKSQMMIVNHLKICSQEVNIDDSPEIIDVSPELYTTATELPSVNNAKAFYETPMNEENLTELQSDAGVEKQMSDAVARRKNKKSNNADSEADDDRLWLPNQKKPKYSNFQNRPLSKLDKRCIEYDDEDEVNVVVNTAPNKLNSPLTFTLNANKSDLFTDEAETNSFNLSECSSPLAAASSSENREIYRKNKGLTKLDEIPVFIHENVESKISLSSFETSKGGIFIKDSFLPKSFSAISESVLNCEAMSATQLSRGRDQLVRELQIYLDEAGLITSDSAPENRKCYQRLGDELVGAFPKFQWCLGINSGKRNHLCQGLLSRLSTRRRSARYERKKMAQCEERSASELSPEEAISKLENLLETANADSAEIVALLQTSSTLRMERPPFLKLPFYMYTKDVLMCEISLRMNKSFQYLKEKLDDLVLRYRVYVNEPTANIYDIETYLKSNVRKGGRFFNITEEFGSFKEKPPGPCILYKESEKEVSLYSMLDGKFIILNGVFDMLEACLVGLGSYFILHIEYPQCYRQFLGLLEIVLGPTPKNPTPFPEVLRINKLQTLLAQLYPG